MKPVDIEASVLFGIVTSGLLPEIIKLIDEGHRPVVFYEITENGNVIRLSINKTQESDNAT